MGERRETQTHPEISQTASAPQDGQLTRQACPECGGVMRLEQLGGIKQYTCHVGHRLGLQSMIADKTDVIERTMWTAVAQSEEVIELLQQAQRDLDPSLVEPLQREIEGRRRDVETLRAVLEGRKASATNQSS